MTVSGWIDAIFPEAPYDPRAILEVARTPKEIRRGLSGRPNTRPSNGMLFMFDDRVDRAMWMKDTWMPLDMIFVDGDAIVGIVENATPLSTNPRRVGRPSTLVIEVAGGSARANGIVPGQRVVLATDCHAPRLR